ncbi:MAG: hypothetical protein K6E33_02995 [Lachnospiraceae bacterium]|nr:hypothetical protein [Lachnospiraceae bacterium]
MDINDKNKFLEENQEHIIRLASRITGKPVTKSDDEWSIALSAVSKALDSHSEERGPFWPYASVVMKNALTDLYRSNTKGRMEMPVQPGAFDGELDDTEGNLSDQMDVQGRASVTFDNSLALEIEAAQKEFKDYGFSFFDLADSSPKSQKTRAGCANVLRALFTPPPLDGELVRGRKLPVRELVKRSGEKQKLLERHRNYLVAAALILRADEYPALSEYFEYTGIRPGGKLNKR